MMKRLTVHIGAIKTGSTSIQVFLKENATALAQNGVVVPDPYLARIEPVTGNQVEYFDRPEPNGDRQEEVTELVNALFDSKGVRQVLISAENLSEGDNSSTAAHWFADVVDMYDTEVIVYLRRQDDVLLSAWQQWGVKIETDLWAWLVARVGTFADWRLMLQRWEGVVGRDRIRVRLYERDRLCRGDVVSDFEEYLGTTELALARNNGYRFNPSFGEAVIDLVRGGGFFRDLHDPEFYDFLTETLGYAYSRRGRESALTYEQRASIVDRYADANAWVRDAYFSGIDVPETLFQMPQPGDFVVPDADELQREQLQMVARLVFELSRRQGT
jgi:hypothetical protein